LERRGEERGERRRRRRKSISLIKW